MTAPDHMLEDANGTCMKRGIHTWSLRQTRGGSAQRFLTIHAATYNAFTHQAICYEEQI